MNTSIMRLVPCDGDETSRHGGPPVAPAEDRLASHVRRAIMLARGWLQSQQHSRGSWLAEQEGDASLESQYILLLALLGQGESTSAQSAARHLRDKQLADGGWARFPDGPLDLDISVLAYLALKLSGQAASSEAMQRAREAILWAGGADGVSGLTRYWLALFGQISYDLCPNVSAGNVFGREKSRTAQSMLLASLAVVREARPVYAIDAKRGIRELFVQPPKTWDRCASLQAGSNTSRRGGRIASLLKHRPHLRIPVLCRRKQARLQQYLLDAVQSEDRQQTSLPALVWTIAALRCLGHADDSLPVRCCREWLQDLVSEDHETVRLNPGKSPAADTALAVASLLESGLTGRDLSVRDATDWLLEAGHADGPHADILHVAQKVLALSGQLAADSMDDDSLSGLQLLGDFATDDEPEVSHSANGGLASGLAQAERALLAAQNRDGGWPAQSGAASGADVTGCVLEALGRLGHKTGDRCIDRAVKYLRTTQQADGSWAGNCGVGHVSGTSRAIAGLVAAGLPADDPAIAAGAAWLLAYQQPCGGWGESPASSEDPRLCGQGPVTASQTAWAVCGLLAAGHANDPAVLRAARFLVSAQEDDGGWHEPEFTAVGAAGYYRNSLHRTCYPLIALSRWLKAQHKAGSP